MRNINHSRVPRVVLVAALLPLAACATPPAYQAPQRTQAVRAVETPRRTDPPEPLSPAAREQNLTIWRDAVRRARSQA